MANIIPNAKTIVKGSFTTNLNGKELNLLPKHAR
jgi:hypothetical protein